MKGTRGKKVFSPKRIMFGVSNKVTAIK